jgi:hypothetical protein
MEAWWISALVGGTALFFVLRAMFFVFRVKICRGSAQVVVWSSRISSGCGDLRIVTELQW